MRYWVAERWDQSGGLLARWTTERPGRTGPWNLPLLLGDLQQDGWLVYPYDDDPQPG